MNNKLNKTKYQMSILRPGGNDTMLIKGLILDPSKKKLINNQIMSLFPTIEQVGFYDFDSKTNIGILEMAGGEFCGNALRSLAFLLLNGKDGEILVKVSGVNKKLIAGVKNKNAYAEMPILENIDCVRELTPTISMVTLEGITHLVTKKTDDLSNEELKKLGKELLKKANLLTTIPASGVMFITEEDNLITLDPVVWVRDIKTLFYETACASGTTAVGLCRALRSDNNETNLKIKQPSGYYINISIKKDGQCFSSGLISGPIQLLEQTEKELYA